MRIQEEIGNLQELTTESADELGYAADILGLIQWIQTSLPHAYQDHQNEEYRAFSGERLVD